MDCDNVKELLPFLDDGSLDALTVQRVRMHLLKCRTCEMDYISMKRVVGLVRDTIHNDERETIPGYLGLVRKRIESRKKARVFYMRAVSVAAVIVFAVAVSLVGFMQYNTTVPVSDDYAATETAGSLEDYATMQDIDVYDLNQLVVMDDSVDRDIFVNALHANTIVNVTPEDIIQLMDDDQLDIMFASNVR